MLVSTAISDAELVDLAPIVRRVVAARVAPGEVDDLAQEAMARIAATRGRLAPETLPAYAVVTARNVVASSYRGEARRRRLGHRLADVRTPAPPDEGALAAEEADALRLALTRVSPEARRLLDAHHVAGTPTGDLASGLGVSGLAVRLRLARARAELRVEYVLALRRCRLPSPDCRSVLVALSSGDRRSQERLGVASHLVTCPVCPEVAEAVTARRRPVAALAPLLAAWWKRIGRTGHQVVSASAATAAVVAVAVTVYAVGRDDGRPTAAPPPSSPAPTPTPSTAAPPPPRLSINGAALPDDPAGLGGQTGRSVRARAVPVLDVPADEGFWVAADGGGRVWVQLTDAEESRPAIRPGAKVSFEGALVAHDSGFPARVGVDAREGAGQLARQGRHIEVPTAAVKVGR